MAEMHVIKSNTADVKESNIGEIQVIESPSEIENTKLNDFSAFHFLVRLRNLFFLICGLACFARIVILSFKNNYPSDVLDSLSMVVVAIIGISAGLGIMVFFTEFRFKSDEDLIRKLKEENKFLKSSIRLSEKEIQHNTIVSS